MVFWTILGTEPTGCAFISVNVARTQVQFCLELSRFSLQCQEISIGNHLYIWRPTGLYQLWCQDSDRAIIGWEGLVKLGHNAAHGRLLFNQVYVVSQIGQIKSCLDSSNTTAQNHYSPFSMFHCFTHNVTPNSCLGDIKIKLKKIKILGCYLLNLDGA